MRFSNFTQGAPTRCFGVSAAGLALTLAMALPAAAEDAPSLARTISYDAADLWSPQSESASRAVSSAVYLTSAPLQPTLDEGVEPCQACEECGGGGAWYGYNRCGCSTGLFPWFTGPGACDNWCVGPHWEVAIDGLILFREGVDFGAIPLTPGFTTDLIDQFDEAPGARIFVTGYNDSGFGMQVGYEGVNDFHANALSSNAAGDTRTITYESNINSLEVNFVRRTEARWRPFAGVRYIELDDDFVDFTRQAQIIPPPSTPPAPPAAFIDNGTAFLLDNRLIGLQGGVFRDMWRLNRWVTIEPFGNAGVYFNDFRREQVNTTVTTIISGEDLSTPATDFTQFTNTVQTSTVQEISELAFAGEAGITGVFRLNRCVALRAGYQVLVVDRVGQGIDAFQAPGLNPTTLVYHGGHFGIEYVR